MKIEEEDYDLELMLDTVEKEIEWYDLQLKDENSLTLENKKKLLQKKYATLSGLNK